MYSNCGNPAGSLAEYYKGFFGNHYTTAGFGANNGSVCASSAVQYQGYPAGSDTCCQGGFSAGVGQYDSRCYFAIPNVFCSSPSDPGPGPGPGPSPYYAALTYDANGGDDPPLPQIEEEGTVVTVSLPGDMIPPPGYIWFMSWNTDADGHGTTYYPGSPITLDSDITLYAQWSDTRMSGKVEDNPFVDFAAFEEYSSSEAFEPMPQYDFTGDDEESDTYTPRRCHRE